jgi:N,N-dimethylformamidase
MKYDYEIITDEDLHREGVAALKPYRVVLNWTHNEYYSERMMDATEDYLEDGGRLLYLGGNGHYWCVGFRDDEPWVMEVSKLEGGSRAWRARAGEHYLASTGERSGLWRHRGRPPQKLVGVGFTSEGMDMSVPYRRMPDSYHRAVSWIFAGVEVRSSAISVSPAVVPLASRSTATTLPSARCHTHASWPRRSRSATTTRWCRRRSTS